jgi:nicotinate-nucleotide adenylyltransferase
VRNGFYFSRTSAFSQFLPCIDCRLERLPEGLKKHIDNVARLAFNYAIALEQSPRNALLAGLGHDLFRISSSHEIFSFCKSSGYELTAIEKQVPMLAHGAAAAGFFSRCYSLADEELLDALRFHTFPVPELGLPAQILIVSDCLEPGRKIAFRDSLRTADMPWENLYREVVAIKEAARPK